MANQSTLKTILETQFGQSSLFDFDSTTGQLIPNTSNVLDAIKSLVRDIFNSNVDVEDETPIGRLCEAWALSIARFCSVTAVYANQINPNYATGQLLDALGSLFSIERTGATPVVINVSCAGVVGTVIPADSQISDGTGNTFKIRQSVTIPSGGTITAKAVCTTNGPKEVPIGSVINIDSNVAGWLSVTNTGIDTPGTSLETDFHFRNRVVQARWTGTAFVQAIRAEIERLDNIDSAIVIENVYSTYMYLKSDKTFSDQVPASEPYLILRPHSICVIVYSRTWSSALQKNVAKAIYNTKSVGCDYTALDRVDQQAVKGFRVTQDVTDDYSDVTYPIVFSKPIEINFGVNVRVSKNKFSGNPEELQAKVVSAVSAWANGTVPFVDGMALGQSIYSYEIGAAISDVIPEIQVKDVAIVYGWIPGKTYALGDLVLRDRTEGTSTFVEKYICKSAHVAGTEWSDANWAPWSTTPAWSSETTYAVGDVVAYHTASNEDAFYKCNTQGQSSTFVYNNWTLLRLATVPTVQSMPIFVNQIGVLLSNQGGVNVTVDQ